MLAPDTGTQWSCSLIWFLRVHGIFNKAGNAKCTGNDSGILYIVCFDSRKVPNKDHRAEGVAVLWIAQLLQLALDGIAAQGSSGWWLRAEGPFPSPGPLQSLKPWKLQRGMEHSGIFGHSSFPFPWHTGLFGKRPTFKKNETDSLWRIQYRRGREFHRCYSK